MLAAFLAFLGGLIPAVVKAWFAGRKAPEIAEGEKAGGAERAAADAQAQAAAAQKVAQAEADAPQTQAEVVAAIKSEDF